MKSTVFSCLVICFISIVWADIDSGNEQHAHDSEFIMGKHIHEKPTIEKIVSWKEVEPHSRPFQVGLEIYWEDKFFNFCGGSLISTSFVLTAAHCFTTLSIKMEPSRIQNIEVILGAHNISKLEPTQVRINTTEVIIHNEWSEPFENDIALVKLPEPVTLNKYIALVSLPSKDNVNNTFTGFEATVSGWGEDRNLGIIFNSSVLSSSANIIISQGKCSWFFPQTISPSQLCVSGEEINTCGGDGGGPLTIQKGSKELLVGVVSFGDMFCTTEYPYVYTRVTSYLDWIQENIKL